MDGILQTRKNFWSGKRSDDRTMRTKPSGRRPLRPCYERHDTGPGHPESAARYRVLEAALGDLAAGYRAAAGAAGVGFRNPAGARAYYHDVVYRDVETFADVLRTGDTAICEDSYDVALEATGAVLEAADAVMRGEVASAFCAVRPPGHHATAARGMGFCIFNHVAVAARYLRSAPRDRADRDHRLGRASRQRDRGDLHRGSERALRFAARGGNYPYTGPAAERGEGAGEGST